MVWTYTGSCHCGRTGFEVGVKLELPSRRLLGGPSGDFSSAQVSAMKRGRRSHEPPTESAVSDPVEALILDLLEWIGPRPRAYAEVMEAWRTSCPRLPVWEDANDRGLVERHEGAGGGVFVSVTARGRQVLGERRRRIAGP